MSTSKRENTPSPSLFLSFFYRELRSFMLPEGLTFFVAAIISMFAIFPAIKGGRLAVINYTALYTALSLLGIISALLPSINFYRDIKESLKNTTQSSNKRASGDTSAFVLAKTTAAAILSLIFATAAFATAYFTARIAGIKDEDYGFNIAGVTIASFSLVFYASLLFMCAVAAGTSKGTSKKKHGGYRRAILFSGAAVYICGLVVLIAVFFLISEIPLISNAIKTDEDIITEIRAAPIIVFVLSLFYLATCILRVAGICYFITGRLRHFSITK
ncbi:MAG: hypothetical protein WBI55_03835 [Eubacteriales bacterium]|jgi:hypothetical protein|nr:hypothetical protein [Clostridiales bacterium]